MSVGLNRLVISQSLKNLGICLCLLALIGTLIGTGAGGVSRERTSPLTPVEQPCPAAVAKGAVGCICESCLAASNFASPAREKPVCLVVVSPGCLREFLALKAGDRIVSVNGVPIREWAEAVRSSCGPGTLEVAVLRRGALVRLKPLKNVRPDLKPEPVLRMEPQLPSR